MTTENINVIEAKKSLKYHIKFLESLKAHISGNDEAMKSRAMFASWCLHRYINDQFMRDIEKAINDSRIIKD